MSMRRRILIVEDDPALAEVVRDNLVVDGFDVMERLSADPVTAAIPVIICTSSVLTSQQRGRLNRARGILSKATLTREVMQNALTEIWPADEPIAVREARG